MKRSLKQEFLYATLLTLVIPYLAVAVAGGLLLRKQILNQTHLQMLNSVNMAREIYNHALSDVENTVRLTANHPSVIQSLKADRVDDLKQLLSSSLETSRLGWMTVVSPYGVCLLCTMNDDLWGESLLHDPMVRLCLEKKVPVVGAQLLTEVQLKARSTDLMDQAAVVPGEETRALVLQAAVPVFDARRRFLGVLTGATLLNRDVVLVDKIRETIFREILYRGRVAGVAELYLRDHCIATNLMDGEEHRFLERPTPEAIQRVVFGEGQRLLERIRWKGKPLITATEPLLDFEGKTIAALTVSIPERALVRPPWTPMILFQAMVALSLVIAILLANWHARAITRPIGEMSRTARLVADGDYNQFVTLGSSREMVELAESFNHMTRQLKELVGNLEAKVDERTEKIRSMQERLAHTEKLASIGKLAAGVAHEINNPLTAILTNASILADGLPEGDPRKTDMEVVVRETLRCRKITRGLLNFARQSPPETLSVCLNEVVENTLRLVRHQLKGKQVTLHTHLQPEIPEIQVDVDQIQQVFLNLIMNAQDAMAGGGDLTVSTRHAPPWVTLSVSDTGTGIPEEMISRIFDPFFTTKEEGTGLGLSISYGIMQRHGGDIRVSSEVGRGTTFILQFPDTQKGQA